jgi:lysophospholipase L1-like esterase
MLKANPKYNTKKRPWFEIYKDTLELDIEAENIPLLDILLIP